MPERSGYKTDGGWSTGNEQVNGTSVNQTLTVNDRDLNTPDEYKASKWIELTDGFESGSSDEFVAYIADGTNTTAGNTNGSGGENNGYRYGFNGKENDDEVKGVGNQEDYGMRIYDGRLGKFLSVDPLTKDFPWYTPYQFAGNTPIWAIDLDGTEEKKMSFTEKWKLLIEIVINKLAQQGNDIREIEGERRGNADQGLAKVVEHYSNQLMLAHAHVEMTQNATSGAKGRPTNSSTIASQADDLAFVSVKLKPIQAEAAIPKAQQIAAGLKPMTDAERLALIRYIKTASQEAGSVARPKLSDGYFAQPNHSNQFSDEGQKVLGVKYLSEGVQKLKNGDWEASKLPIDYVVRNGKTYFLNTRSIATLRAAGIPESKWVFNNQTGVPAFERNLTNNLNGAPGFKQVTNRVTNTVTSIP